MSMPYSLGEIVLKLGGELIGNGDLLITHVAPLSKAKSSEITFLTASRYLFMLADTQASAVVVSEEYRHATNIPRIVTDNPYAYFARLSALLNPAFEFIPGIDVSAVVDITASVPDSCVLGANCVIGKNVRLGEGVVIGAGSVIEEGVTIEDGSQLQANVVIYRECHIGKRCTVAAGVIIGSDGFGYAEESGQWIKIPQVGRVLVGDHVEIGANTTIDRGTLDDTVIEEGVKLDNQIQIGHNCHIGAHTVIAGCVGIAGSAVIGKHCRIGGAAMILGHLEIADGITVSPGTMVTRSLKKPGTYTALMPFQLHEDWVKTAANIRRLGDIGNRVRQLEKSLKPLKRNEKQIKEKP